MLQSGSVLVCSIRSALFIGFELNETRSRDNSSDSWFNSADADFLFQDLIKTECNVTSTYTTLLYYNTNLSTFGVK